MNVGLNYCLCRVGFYSKGLFLYLLNLSVPHEQDYQKQYISLEELFQNANGKNRKECIILLLCHSDVRVEHLQSSGHKRQWFNVFYISKWCPGKPQGSVISKPQ